MATSPKQPSEAGTTRDSAIRIQAANSFEGIPKEYAILFAMFGVMDRDWKLIDRSLVHGGDGRKLDRFIISFQEKRKEIYFDITDWVNRNTPEDLKRAIADWRPDKPLTVLLPQDELCLLLRNLTEIPKTMFNELGLFSPVERSSIIDPFIDALKPYGDDYAAIPEHVSVTTLISVWLKIWGILTQWRPRNLRQEKKLENLKARIQGTMMDARR